MSDLFKLPDELKPDDFLSRYWQKAPLLIRRAITPPKLKPEELAGLACEEGVESRIVLECNGRRPWELRHGPFATEDFAVLPDSHWTLLVQDVDKLVPEAAELLAQFRFIPDWRIDDIMISYAVDQGSVGPHTDAYDVFLIQTHGRRRWQIHQQTVADEDLIPDLDLRILKHFEAEQEWIVEPGDILYLPPEVAHWGVALGDCMTWSIGFRAPSAKEIAASWLDHRLESLDDRRFCDPGREPTANPGEITTKDIDDNRRLVEAMLSADGDTFARWLCAYLSEPKENLATFTADTPVDTTGLKQFLLGGGRLRRSLTARMLYHPLDGEVLLAAGGEVHSLSPRLLTLARTLGDLAPGRQTDFSSYVDDDEALSLLATLYNSGQLETADEDSV